MWHLRSLGSFYSNRISANTIEFISAHATALTVRVVFDDNFSTFAIICITRDSEVIMFLPCVFVCLCVCVCGGLCLSRCLSGRFNYEGLVPHKLYFAGTLLGMSSCASYVSRTHDVINDVTRSQSRSNFEILQLERRSKAQNVGNAHGYLSDIFNFRYYFR